jgi:hypothetical protein
MELKLKLTFACCACSGSMTTLLACRGDGLSEPDGEEVIAAVNVECPACGQLCQVVFAPHRGVVREVRPARPNRGQPAPSRN